MFGSFLITFREGLEAFLIVGIILAYLGRADLAHYKKWIYLGSFLALISAFGLAVVFQIVYAGFGSERTELYIKVGIMALAVLVLSYMLIWMSRNSVNLKSTIEAKLEQSVDTGSVFALVFMAYLAILREGFETVLFLGAMFGSNMHSGVFYGGLWGIVASLLLVVFLFKSLRQVPLKLFFSITSGLILFIAAGLLSNMVGILQDIHMIPIIKAQVMDLRWILDDSSDVGIFFKALFGYTATPSVLQIVSYFTYISTVIVLYNRPVAHTISGEASCA